LRLFIDGNFKLFSFKLNRNEAYLQIEASEGGMWRYPLKFVAVEPPPDDTITIEVTRLYKEFLVGFKLSSKIE